MKPLGLAVAASLLTVVALSPRPMDMRATSGGHAPNGASAARSGFSRHGAALLAQNDQMYMQQENSGADTGDQSPPDDQSVDTETGDAAEPEAAAPDAGGDSGNDASGADESDGGNSGDQMNNEGGGANQDQPPEAQP
jgi:hypothetical protein